MDDYWLKKLEDKNIDIVNLAYIVQCVSLDEPMKPEVEKIFDKGLIENKFLYEHRWFLKVSEANQICDKLLQQNKLTDENLTKAIKKRAMANHKASDREHMMKGSLMSIGYGLLSLILNFPQIFFGVLIILSILIILGVGVFIKHKFL